MPVILLADDSELDTMVVLEILRKEPLDWLIEVVKSAEEAIALMRQVAFDVVITDVLMEGMSGLELLNHVHRQPQRVPVIVISGQDDQSAAIEALRQGAASYVPKNELSARLGETVKRVYEAARSKQNYDALLGFAEEMRFRFQLGNDPIYIQPMISLLQHMADGMKILTSEARTRLGVALDEALMNAICHGNLELSEQDLIDVRSHLHTGLPIHAIESRRATPNFTERQVHVSAGLSREGIKVIVRDDGKGFSPSALHSESAQRGITLIKNLVDDMSFNDEGNEIRLVKRRDQTARTTPARAKTAG